MIVNVASGLGSFDRVHDASRIESEVIAMAYCSSKSAVVMLTVQYAKASKQAKGTGKLEYLTITLTGVTVTSFQAQGGADTARETFSLSFARFKFSYQAQDRTGAKRAGGNGDGR